LRLTDGDRSTAEVRSLRVLPASTICEHTQRSSGRTTHFRQCARGDRSHDVYPQPVYTGTNHTDRRMREVPERNERGAIVPQPHGKCARRPPPGGRDGCAAMRCSE
jgi:hypothetical protein